MSIVGPAQRTILLLRQEPGAPPDTPIFEISPLEPAYRARWKVLAQDGHVTEGVLSFSVRDAQP
jgi:hypothetical protein